MRSLHAGGTLAAHPFHHVVDAVQAEPLGQVDDGDMDGAEAERAVTHLAVEMRMHVVYAACIFVGTDLVLERAAAVLDVVHQVMSQEQVQRAEDGRAVGFTPFFSSLSA